MVLTLFTLKVVVVDTTLRVIHLIIDQLRVKVEQVATMLQDLHRQQPQVKQALVVVEVEVQV